MGYFDSSAKNKEERERGEKTVTERRRPKRKRKTREEDNRSSTVSARISNETLAHARSFAYLRKWTIFSSTVGLEFKICVLSVVSLIVLKHDGGVKAVDPS